MLLRRVGYIILLVLFFTGIFPAKDAFALSCYGSTCNNKDPNAYGCSAITVSEVYGSGASGPMDAQLRYSSGCGTQWTKVENENLNTRHLKGVLTVHDVAFSVLTSEDLSNYSYIWTNMYVTSVDGRCTKGWQGYNNSLFDTNTSYTCHQ